MTTDRIHTVVVLGGSAAGLLAAAAAARHASRVVLIERDALGTDITVRKGVPQANHSHNLFARGRAIFEQLVPGFGDALRARGGHLADSGAQLLWSIGGRRLAPVETHELAAIASRACIDASLLDRLRLLPNVTFLDRTDVVGLHFEGERASGVRIARRADDSSEETLQADLAIDCTGRGTRLAAWLEPRGVGAPPVDEVEIRVAYATRTFRRAHGDLEGALGLLSSHRPPDLACGGVAFAIEGDRWRVLLYGYMGEKPPTDLEGFRAYARRCADPELGRLVARAEPLDEGVPFAFPRAARRRWDRVGVPEGVLVLGDALVSTNPCWGAGMTSAALQAEALDRMLARGVPTPARWHAEALAASEDIWMSTTQNDRALAVVPGAPIFPMRVVQRYVDMVCRAATTDPIAARAMLGVIDRVAPPQTIFHPRIAWRALTGGGREAAPSRILGQ